MLSLYVMSTLSTDIFYAGVALYMLSLYDGLIEAILGQGNKIGGRVMESAVMARPKKKPVEGEEAQWLQSRQPSRSGVVGMRVVELAADHCRTDVAKLVDAALIDYLKAKGFEEDPPRR